MSLWFQTLAAGQLIKRRKGPVVRMVAVALISTVWLVVGGWWTVATWRTIDRQASDVRVDMMVRSDAQDSVVRTVVRDLADLPSVGFVRFVRENEVWREFSGEVGADEDLRAVVSMPRFIRITPTAEAATEAQLLLMNSAILSRYSNVVFDVVWPRDYVRMIDARRNDLLILAIAAGALSLIMFILAASYAFRAELHAAGADLRVGALLGASTVWIAMPHLLVGLFAGAVGLALAAALLAAGAPLAAAQLPWLQMVPPEELGMMIGGLASIGMVVAVTQALAAARAAQQVRAVR